MPFCLLELQALSRSRHRLEEKRLARRFRVSGRVQGVGYRFFVCSVAEEQGVCGYVRNLADGQVEVYAIGTGKQLRALRDALKRGPRLARVEKLGEEAAEVLPPYASGFNIEQA
jgi:acylphosphatase